MRAGSIPTSRSSTRATTQTSQGSQTIEILRPHGLGAAAGPRAGSRRLAHRLRVGSSTDHPSPLGDNTRKRKVGRTTDKVQNQMNLWPCTSRALFSANHQRTTSRTDPHTHDPHFSQPSPAVLPARSADRRGRARQSQIHGFLMQKWKQACSCHLNVSPSRKRPESVTHDRHGRKDRPGDRGTARGAKPQAKLAPLIVPS